MSDADIGDLSPTEIIALSQEIDATSSLFRHGFRILGEYRFAARDAEPLFACMSGGAEKLLKLTYGLTQVGEGDRWPAQATMKDAGHKIVELDVTVRGLVARRQHLSTAPDLIARLLAMTEAHPGVVQALATLERYAVDGRFYNLDLLGRREQGNPSPHELWDSLEMDVIEANPEMVEQFAGPRAPAARNSMNEIIAWSLGSWCELLVRSWTTGVCGGFAKQWSPQLDLGHPPPHPFG